MIIIVKNIRIPVNHSCSSGDVLYVSNLIFTAEFWILCKLFFATFVNLKGLLYASQLLRGEISLFSKLYAGDV